jgi:hypothetical protein
MEIIERGTLPTERQHEIRCRNCKTLFRFKCHEATYVPDERDGDFLSINCPVCGDQCTVTP